MECFDTFVTADDAADSNGHVPSSSGQASPSVSVSPPRYSRSSPRKHAVDSEGLADDSNKTLNKKRRTDNDVDADAILAAKLQAEENMRARPTRGASSRSHTVKRKSKPKSAAKLRAEDNSFLESGKEKEVNRSSGFHVSLADTIIHGSRLLTIAFNIQKPLNLSPALSDLMGGEISVGFSTLVCPSPC